MKRLLALVAAFVPVAALALSSASNYTTFSAGQVLTHSHLNSLQSHYTTLLNEERAYFPGTDSLKVKYVLPDTLKERTAGAGITLDAALIAVNSSDSLGIEVGRIDTLDVDTLAVGDGGRAWLSYAQIDSINTDSLTVIGPAVFSGAMSAGSTLDVVGDVTVDNGSMVVAGYGRIDTVDTDSLTVIGPVTVSAPTHGTGVPAVWLHSGDNAADHDGVVVSAVNNGSDAEVLHVRTNNTTYANGTSLMLVRGDGNVGIGTATPRSILEVVDDLSSTAQFTSTALLNIVNSNQTANTWGSVGFVDGDNQGVTAALQAKFTDHANNYGELHLATRGASGLSSRVVVDEDGNVGIGTASPSSPLHVYDNTALSVPVLDVHQDNPSATAAAASVTQDATGEPVLTLLGASGQLSLVAQSAVGSPDSVDVGSLADITGSPNGYVDVFEGNGNCAATFYLRGGNNSVAEVADPLSCASVTKGTASSLNLYYSATAGVYYIENNRGSSQALQIFYRGF